MKTLIMKYKTGKVIKSLSNNIFNNLAYENQIYKSANLEEPVLILYQNSPSIIIGRNQNAWKECKLERIKLSKVNLCRRKSGGGAVYQDLGNLCFGFIIPLKNNDIPSLDIKFRNNSVVIGALNGLGINATAKGRNDLEIDGMKISGSAFEVELGSSKVTRRVLHHGTLLYNVNIDRMEDYLNPNILKLQSKGIESIKARVTNIKDKFPSIKLEDIYQSIIESFKKEYVENSDMVEEVTLLESDIESNQNCQVVIKAMTDPDFLLGKNSEFSNSFEKRFDWGVVEFNADVEKGQIIKCEVFSDSLFPDFIDKLKSVFKENNIEYSKRGIQEVKSLLSVKVSDLKEMEALEDLTSWIESMIE